MSNEQRQSIYEDDMVPHLRSCDMNGAITVALDKVDAALTPENMPSDCSSRARSTPPSA